MICPTCGKVYEGEACPWCAVPAGEISQDEPDTPEEGVISTTPEEVRRGETEKAVKSEVSETTAAKTETADEDGLAEPSLETEPTGIESDEDNAELALETEPTGIESDEDNAESALETEPTGTESDEDSVEPDGDQTEEELTEQLKENIEPEKKNGVKILIGIVIAALTVAVIVLSMMLYRTTRGSEQKDGDAIIASDPIDAEAIAVQVTGPDEYSVEVTNEEFAFYFWGEYYYYVNNNGFTFDPLTDLKDQVYDEESGKSWQDYFSEMACDAIKQVYLLKNEAEKSGFEITDLYQQEYDSVVQAMETNAVSSGFAKEDGTGDILAYIQDSYGQSTTVEGFQKYLYDSYYVSSYSEYLYNSTEYDDAALETYYEENKDLYEMYGIQKSDLADVSVRHILIQPEQDETDEDGVTSSSDAAWEAAEEKAQSILAEWEGGEQTEERFAELANSYSEDTGSNTAGGLYEDVYPGQMVTEFNDWCFDPERETGDVEIVKTSYGYHIMYFVGYTDNYYWKQAAEGDLRSQDYSTAISELMEQYQTVTTEEIDVEIPSAVLKVREDYQSSQDASAGAEASVGTGEESAVG